MSDSWQYWYHSNDNWANRKSLSRLASMGVLHMWHRSLSRLQETIVLKYFWRTPTSFWLTTWSKSTCCKHSRFSFFLCVLNLNWWAGKTSSGNSVDTEPDISCPKDNALVQSIHLCKALRDRSQNLGLMSHLTSQLFFWGRVQLTNAFVHNSAWA